MEQPGVNSGKYYRALVENSSDIVAVLDAGLVVRYASNAVETILGYGLNEVVGREILSFMDENWVKPVTENFKEIISKPGTGFRREIKFIRQNGNEVYLETAAKNLLDDESVRGIIINAADITEKKHTNEKLKNIIWQLDRTNSELEQFACAASHDLKEPLRMISNYLDLIQMRQGRDFTPETKEFMNFAAGGAARMYALIQAMLAYSGIGRKPDGYTDVDLNLVIEDILNELNGMAEGIKIEAARMPVVRAHQVEMTQLFYNLLNNAVKFRGKGRVPFIAVSVEAKDDEFVFTVSDNGIGIEKQYQEKVFRLFERLHCDDEYEGTGIGLSLCKKIVENLGGRIWIESEKDKGTKVFFTMPKKQFETQIS